MPHVRKPKQKKSTEEKLEKERKKTEQSKEKKLNSGDK